MSSSSASAGWPEPASRTPTVGSRCSTAARAARSGSSSTRRRRSSRASSSRCSSNTAITTSRCSARRTGARATAAAERRRARRAVRGADGARREARCDRGSARARTRGRAWALGRGEERGARRTSGDRRARRPQRTVRARTGNRPAAAGARGAEPPLRSQVRLSVRRLREPAPEVGDRADPPRAARADARGGARDRRRRARADRDRQMAPLVAIADYWWDWGNLLFRWLHVVAAVAWIGSSFYFIALDSHLRPPENARDADRGVGGESWEIHGGGFYRIEKFRVAPETLPERLHWFKWEAYATWLSGFALVVVVYYLDAGAYLVDRSVADLEPWQAIAISVALMAAAWVVYDVLCRALGSRPLLLAGAVAA